MKNKNLIYGLHAVEGILKKQPGRINNLSVLQQRDDKKIQALLQLANAQKIKIDYVSRAELDLLVHEENHQGIIAHCQTLKTYTEDDLEHIIKTVSQPLFLILDTIQDPHNLGACLRSADAAGVDAVIAPRDKSVGITGTVSKVASGAAETVPFIQVTNLARTMTFLKESGVWIYGAAGEAKQNLYSLQFSGAIALAMGAEGSGLRRLTREQCDVLAYIPMQGSVSSLNVSVATGIFLFEVVRQRMMLNPTG